MKNSYRIYPVYGTSALKYEDLPMLDHSNIVEFPSNVRFSQNYGKNLRIQREIPEPSFKTKVDIVLSYIVCSAFCLGIVLSMI